MEIDHIQTQEDISQPYWTEELTPPDDLALILDNDVQYTRQFIRNLRFHQPISAIALNATSGISVKKSLIIDERKTISAIMDEVKYMLDYKVGHYVHHHMLTYDQRKNIF